MKAPDIETLTDRIVRLMEWESYPVERGQTLARESLQDDLFTRRVVSALSQKGMILIQELRNGTRVDSTSWVGRISLGNLQIRVEPKITGLPLLQLLRYTYGLRNLALQGISSYDPSRLSFHDLLIRQLASEAEELIRRGLRREYIRQDADLALLRGRLDLQRYVRDLSTPTTTLPCTFHPRTENTRLNQVLLAGLRLGFSLTSDAGLRASLASRCRMLEEEVARIRLDRSTVQLERRRISRLTSAYAPALTLIGLLVEAQGITLDGEADEIRVPGFLFDMNRFFQALLSRVLSENLTGYEVRDEQHVGTMMAYDPAHNPRRRAAPKLRPDFVVFKRGEVVAVLDAKYRDLWETNLPREMLYQLAMYALSQKERRVATILYPTLDTFAKDAHVVINDMTYGSRAARVSVILRPVNMLNLAALVAEAGNMEARRRFAEELAFGSAG